MVDVTSAGAGPDGGASAGRSGAASSVDGLVRLPLSEGVVSPARNGGKSDRNVDDLFVALNVGESLFTTFRLKIIAGAELIVGGKYSEASRRLLRRAWRVGG